MRGFSSILILALALSLGLSACGRKNPPKLPAGYTPKDGESTGTQGEFKEYRPVKNHSLGSES